MIALTGAAGGVGSILTRGLRRDLRLLDIRPAPGCDLLDVRDLAAVEAAFSGIDAVIHLGAIPTEAPFEDILDHNLRGTYNVLEAARRRGVRRVVFASSNHVTGMYGRAERVGPEDPIRPDTYYGVSKAFGEALGALYSDKHGMVVTCLRIGNVGPRPLDVRRLSIWVSPEDIVQLIRIGLEHPGIRFEIVYGASDNAASWWDNSRARQLGYRPTGKAEDHRAHAEAEQAKIGPDPVGDLFQGGAFCSAEFTNDVKRAGP